MILQVTLAYQKFNIWKTRVTDKSTLLTENEEDNELISFLPETFSSKYFNCYDDVLTVVQVLGDLKIDLEMSHQTDNTNSSAEALTNGTLANDVLLEIQAHIRWFMKRSGYLKRCLREYEEVLAKTIDGKDEALRLAAMFQNQRPFQGRSFNFTHESLLVMQDEKEVERIYKKYSFDKISKLNYLKSFDPDEQSSAITNINSFVGRIQHRLTEPLRDRIQKIRRELQKEYENAFKMATVLQRFLPNQAFYSPAKSIRIWRLPSPNLENPERYEDTGKEYWKVWDQNVDMNAFTEKHLPRHVEAGLDSFCDQLLDVLDGFNNQLQLNKDGLLLALERVQEAYENYMQMRQVQHQFVL